MSACIAAALVLMCVTASSEAAPAVTNCSASGNGSLAAAVAGAASGDTVDMTALNCSAISLAGTLFIEVPNLTIAGPGVAKLTVTSNGNGTLYHQAVGTLSLKDMTITNSNPAIANSMGGCVNAANNLTMLRTVVKNCHMHNTNTLGITEGGGVAVEGDLTMTNSQVTGSSITAGFARGGGIAVHGNAAISGSTISANSVSTSSTGLARTGGGGLYVAGTLTMLDSTVSTNSASSAGPYVVGGGMYVGTKAGPTNVAYLGYSTVSGNTLNSSTSGSAAGIQGAGLYTNKFTDIRFSTVDHNHSSGNGGGIANGPNAKLDLFESTISGNVTQFLGGAIFTSYSKTMSVLNSTIGLNYTQSTGPCGGIFFNAGGTLSITSTIVAQNRKYNQPTLSPCDIGMGTSSTVTMTGSNNLIQQASGNVVPVGTLTDDPLFYPLSDNGGPTRTLGIGTDSPAHATGLNIFNVAIDQRGYPRTQSNHTDIGAFEWQFPGDGDTIFTNGFEILN
ncbi:MAG: choice-of-anchor Q domain-containing protein [Rudaea sp.]